MTDLRLYIYLIERDRPGKLSATLRTEVARS